MTTGRTASHRGILNPASGRAHFRLTRHEPAADLAPWVERHWVVRWDLRGREPYLQETLPHPCVNVVVEDRHGWVFGVGTERAGRLLEGRGEAVGTKFRPGAFAPFSPLPVAGLTTTLARSRSCSAPRATTSAPTCLTPPTTASE
jgi:hypothetical protein